ncbi:SDR family oxidoreductase [Sinimarinibacterium thermocellulolyticum]|uniref:SDR family oxidoreductase n=1 Tax=Sinimarinibacterium thermocellulolyticum TaxID=3170016 RepID=A0ABV2AAH2_9GAMM
MSVGSAWAAAPAVVVTGASQGIGAAIAERFATCVPGVRLALVARDRQRLEAVAARCASTGAQAIVLSADLLETAQVERMAGQVLSSFGSVDVLVNNAGRWRGGAVHEMSVGDFALTLQENLVSMFAVTRAFLPAMLARGRGDLFFVSSTSGLEGLANNAAYCAAKHGVAGLAKAVRAELAGRGLRVCCVYPGATDTPTWDGSGVDRASLIAASDVAQMIVEAHRLSGRSMLEELILRPVAGR